MATSPTPKLEPAPEPQPHRSKYSKVTPEYRKAHKNYVLIAGMLASWELIGIEVNTQDKWGIKLLSPRAVPLILFTLLVYSCYKVIIEWNIEDDPRPKSKKARIDYWVSHAIGASAVSIGAIQAILKIRLADFITAHTQPLSLSGYIAVAAGQFIIWTALLRFNKYKRRRRLAIGVGIPTIVIGSIALSLAIGVKQTIVANIVTALLPLLLFVTNTIMTTFINLMDRIMTRPNNWINNRVSNWIESRKSQRVK